MQVRIKCANEDVIAKVTLENAHERWQVRSPIG